MSKALTEGIGTFFLVLTIGLATTPLAIGAVLMVMIYMGGHVSGAHYNPAVSLAIFWRGKMEKKDLVPYLVAQVLGALLAALAVYVMVGTTFAPGPGPEMGPLAILLAEILFTFALTLVILHVATAKSTAGNDYYGLAIGFTVFAGAVAVGPISGAAFNPAVGIGPTVIHAIFGGGGFGSLWYYIVGPVVGGLLAVPVFRIQNPEED